MEAVVNLLQLQTAYKDKKVFVTGHTGFKGAWLSALLHTAGSVVKGYALAPEQGHSLFNQLHPLLGMESIIADVRDKGRLRSEIQSFEPDYIFHLAAQPLVRRSYSIPAETFEVNVIGTANLLEAMAALSGKCTAVIITTDKVYENKEQHILYKEGDTLGGYDPYSASKACAEIVVSAFRNSFFNTRNYVKHHKAVATARAGNVIGGGDWSTDRIVPDIVRALKNGETIEVRNPFAVRPWQHVLEPLTGYLLLGSMLNGKAAAFSSAYNFGPYPEDHLAVEDLVNKAIDGWGSGTWKNTINDQQPHEANLLQLDISRAIDQLKWHPKLNAAEAIQRTIEWYRQPTHTQAAYTFQQIENYLAE